MLNSKINGLSFFLITLVAIPCFSQPTINPELERLRESLPNKSLTLDFVLARALQNSDSFRAVKSEQQSILVPQLQAEAAFDTQFEFSQKWINNKNEPTFIGSPEQSKSDVLSAGVSRYFSSGTALGLQLSQDHNDLSFPSASLFSRPPYYETKASLNITQKLWADSFGYASRRALRASRLQTEAQKINFRSSIEGWALNVTHSFYLAWFSQRQAMAAREGLKRRERLLKSTKIRLNRGTAEQPDYLQIESAFLRSKAAQLEAEKNLDDHRRRLIVLLKLPLELMQVDAAQIPLKIDEDTAPLAQQTCQSFRKNGLPQSETTDLQKARLLYKSALLNWERAKSESWPDLKLQGSYFLNGVDGQANTSQSETFNQDHPGWSVGLVLTMPFEFKKQKAAISEATAKMMKLEALKNSSEDEKALAWFNECADLERLTKTLEYAKTAFRNQTKRADLEERRFRLGRSSTFNVIQAGDDATEAEAFLHATEIQWRQSAWRVLELNSQLLTHLKSYVKTHGGDTLKEME